MQRRARRRPSPAQAEQAATQAQFRLAQPVSLGAGQSALVTFLDQSVPARRVLLVQPGTSMAHPLAALQLRNATASALPPGIVTLYEEKPAGPVFIGDARLPALPAGATRLTAFAADPAVALLVEPSADAASVTLRAAAGVLEVVTRDRAVTTYRLTGGQAGQPVLVGQPKRQGWTLAEPQPGPGTEIEELPSLWRITRPLGPDGTLALRVVLERPRTERIQLLDQAPDRVLALADTGGLSAEQRAALRRAAELRSAVARAQDAGRQARKETEAVVLDQARVRENLRAVPANSDLARDYLARLRTQETELSAIRARVAAADAEAERATAALREYLENLRL